MATPDDALAMQKVRRAAWLAVYPNDANGVLPEHLPSEYKLAKGAIAKLKRQISTNSEADSLFLVAVTDRDTIIGMVRAVRLGRRGKIDNIFIGPHNQRHEVGSNLLDQALAWLGDTTQTEVDIPIYTGSDVFFEKHGFHRADEDVPFQALSGDTTIQQVKMIRRG